jgi:hypothetical protein
MKNKVEVEGKVLNCYMTDTDALIIRVCVVSPHNFGNGLQNTESVFNTIMIDKKQIAKTVISQGDTVSITGHLKVDINATGHKGLKVYADEIEVIKPHTIRDSTRERLCM